MILTVNVSNSNILLGAYRDDKQCFCSSMHTNLLKSADEYAVQFGSVLSPMVRSRGDISGVILFLRCAPSMLASVSARRWNHPLHGTHIYVAGPGLKTGFPSGQMIPPSLVANWCAAPLQFWPTIRLLALLSLWTPPFPSRLWTTGAHCGRGHSAGCKDWR